MELPMISSAFAQSAAGGAGGFSLQGLLPFVLIFIIFYFLLIRPQQKKVKEHKLMVESLKRGNKVLTAGGILGVVTKAIDGSETVSVEISSGVTVELARQMISEVRGEEKIKAKAVENKRQTLDSKFGQVNKDYVTQFEKRVKDGMEMAQSELSRAIESGDATAQVNAQKRIAGTMRTF